MPSGWCKACGAAVEFDRRLYAERGLHPPERCAKCRADRRARMVSAVGLVTEVKPGRVAWLRTDAGEVFATFEKLGSLKPDQRVRFSWDPKEPRPLARSVEPETTPAAAEA